jgi:hypothetical protein
VIQSISERGDEHGRVVEMLASIAVRGCRAFTLTDFGADVIRADFVGRG